MGSVFSEEGTMNRARKTRVKKRWKKVDTRGAQEVLLWAEATKALLDVMVTTMVFAIAFMLIGAGLWKYATLFG